MGGIWGVTLFFSFFSFGCATPASVAEGCKLNHIHNGMLRV